MLKAGDYVVLTRDPSKENQRRVFKSLWGIVHDASGPTVLARIAGGKPVPFWPHELRRVVITWHGPVECP